MLTRRSGGGVINIKLFLLVISSAIYHLALATSSSNINPPRTPTTTMNRPISRCCRCCCMKQYSRQQQQYPFFISSLKSTTATTTASARRRNVVAISQQPPTMVNEYSRRRGCSNNYLHRCSFNTSAKFSSSSTTTSTTRTNIPQDIINELNSNQLTATTCPQYSITRIIAGPGAGKTRVLTCRIAHLLLLNYNYNNYYFNKYDYEKNNNNDDEGILAVTFTKKSASEMERRLVELLTHSATTITTKQQQQQQQQVDDNNNSNSAVAAVAVVVQQLMKRTTVGTFHSTCSKILRKFGSELGSLPSVCNCLGSNYYSSAGHGGGGATVVVGAQKNIMMQTSTTTTTTNDDDYYIDNNNTNGKIMVPTTTPTPTLDGSFNILDQADQLRLLKDILQKYNIELKSNNNSGGGGSGGGGGSNNEIRPITILNAISLFNTRDAIRGTTTTINGNNNNNNSNDDEIANKVSKKVYKIAMQIRIPFQKAKYSQNSIDFDDLILLTRELLLHHPNVREILHRRYRHVLVDEFQDTSTVQLDLVRLLTTNSLFVVGDGDQSIYSWRGASPESMTDFEVAFHNKPNGWGNLLLTNSKNQQQQQQPQDKDLKTYLERILGGSGGGEEEDSDGLLKVQSVYLMENYRSTSNIVKAAQRIISASTETNKQQNNDDKMSVLQDDIRRDMKPMRGDGPSPRVLACKDAKAEAQFVVQTVNTMVNNGDLKSTSTVAIIYRTNAQSRLLEEACVENNLRYVVRGSSGTFYKRTEIQDCMSFLKIMYNSRDRSAWARAVKSPSRGIGETSLNEFFNYCDAVTQKFTEMGNNREDMPTPLDMMISFAPTANNNDTPIDIASLIPPKDFMSTRSLNRFIPFGTSLRSLRRKAEELSVPDFLLSVIDDLDLKSHFNSLSKTRDEYEDRLGNVMELVRAAERYKAEGPCVSYPTTSLGNDEAIDITTPLGNFLDDVALIADIAPDDDDVDSSEDGSSRIVANLMTIHSSKGMEFDAVFLIGNEEGTFPTQRAIAEGEGSIELSEERRLCYVAMTRAKTHLALTWRREVLYFSGATFKSKDAVRSRFLDILVAKQGKPNTPSREGLNPSTQQPRGNNVPLNSNRRSSVMADSTTKRQINSQATRLLDSKGQSWSNWNPSSQQKKAVTRTPPIELRSSTKSMTNGSDRSEIKSSSPLIMSPQSRIIRGPISVSTKRSIEAIHSPAPQHLPKKEMTIQKQTNIRSSIIKANHGGEPPPDNMDSTLFFPVGSSVKHKLHGKGVVLTPPSADFEFVDKLLVRVKFVEDHQGKAIESTEWDLPMNGLSHTYD